MQKAFSSRTVLTIFLMFIVGGLTAVVPVFPPAVGTILQGILGAFATYFKLNPSQTY